MEQTPNLPNHQIHRHFSYRPNGKWSMWCSIQRWQTFWKDFALMLKKFKKWGNLFTAQALSHYLPFSETLPFQNQLGFGECLAWGREPELSQLLWVLLKYTPLLTFAIISNGFNHIFGYLYFIDGSFVDSERENLLWVRNSHVFLRQLQSPETPTPKKLLHQDRWHCFL